MSSINSLPSARQYLADSFGDRASDVRVGGFHRDPGSRADVDWTCHRAEEINDSVGDELFGREQLSWLDAVTAPDGAGKLPNVYFCPFLMKGPRSTANFEAAVQIPVDDVGSEEDVLAEKARLPAALAEWKAKCDEAELFGDIKPPEPKMRVKVSAERLDR